jgi:Arc/MetJ family transcription regulator
MGCVVAPTDDCVVLLIAREGVGVTAALAVTAMREIKVTARRKRVASLLPRALQRCVRTCVLLRGDTRFPGCSFEKAAA